MTEIYGAPQPLSGNETVTILQQQNGQLAECTAPISDIAALSSFDFATYMQSLPTTLPSKAGAPWNNGGILSIS
ncbi:hypothetical protein [Acidiphilium sp.]|uniref:hypothetical protein n=1 Tax=Acidiphilium sp. TaxID=527 RepID=UPI002CE52F0F|nr:hypothetical protein [Acidiphilium sp.]HQT62196.1 hypothetical protein [Acidiphilium sp.]